jgi:hypothetical protein
MTKKYSNFILKMLTVIFPICQLNDDSKVLTYILKMFTVTFPICQLNDD